MIRRLQLAPWLLLLGTACAVCGGEIIDRIVATVNGSAILASDWDQAVRCEALLQGRPLEPITAADQQATLQRLIDQQLLREQMGKPAAIAEDTVSARLRQVRSALPEAQTDAGWHALLARYGVSEADVRERLVAQMQISGFIEDRLRPSVHVDSSAVQTYYRDKLLPELRQSGIKTEPPLAEVSARIQEILLQQRLDEELTAWLQSLRQQANIRTQPLPEPPEAQQPAPKGGWHREADVGNNGK